MAKKSSRLNSHLSDKEVDLLKNKLLAEKERIINKYSMNAQFTLDRDELSDPVDGASIDMQTSEELRFRSREGFLVKKINKALDKVEKEVFGLCDDCGADINFVRLEARPVAELCIICKEEAEMDEKSSFHKSRSKGRTLQELT